MPHHQGGGDQAGPAVDGQDADETKAAPGEVTFDVYLKSRIRPDEKVDAPYELKWRR